MCAAEKSDYWHNLRIDATRSDASVELEALHETGKREAELMAQLDTRADIVSRPLHGRWVRDLSGKIDPPD